MITHRLVLCLDGPKETPATICVKPLDPHGVPSVEMSLSLSVRSADQFDGQADSLISQLQAMKVEARKRLDAA